MKKFLAFITIFFLISNVTFAAVDENYFNGDKNYIYCGASMGAGYFVDRSSLIVEKYNPPIYVISIDVLSAGHYYDNNSVAKLGRRYTERFLYDYSTKKMYYYTPNGGGKYMRSRYENNYRGRNDKFSKEKLKMIDEIDWNSDWTLVDPDVFYGEGAVFPTVGEIAFALAYNLKFYGSNYQRFKGKFYDKIGNIKDNL